MGVDHHRQTRAVYVSSLLFCLLLLKESFVSAQCLDAPAAAPTASPISSPGLYQPSDSYLINCGSSEVKLDDGRIFKSDTETSSYLSTDEDVQTKTDSMPESAFTNSTTSSLMNLYKAARIFTSYSKYLFSVSVSGKHWVRLYFYSLRHEKYDLKTVDPIDQSNSAHSLEPASRDWCKTKASFTSNFESMAASKILAQSQLSSLTSPPRISTISNTLENSARIPEYLAAATFQRTFEPAKNISKKERYTRLFGGKISEKREITEEKRGEGEFFETGKEDKKKLPEDKKENQKADNASLIKSIEGVSDLKAYLAARFSLKSGMKPHEFAF
ncbi:hypothetical protein F3Y22_tig00110156pilonHSYRG00245 [Hibiscus syriacus]|uniref:Malectin domain-containing protein n=1 Tax=Hibiscus syriacus TaxID=106335 RepID=A0A6A3BH88_HIBSY|nr:hypothetical protein F3Y22_tig00110156pilonHSYRG00245 [Hibiscus syriacus]